MSGGVRMADIPKLKLILLSIGLVLLILGFMIMIGWLGDFHAVSGDVYTAQNGVIGLLIMVFGFVSLLFYLKFHRSD